MQIINIKISNITSLHNNRLFGEMTKMINYFKCNLLGKRRFCGNLQREAVEFFSAGKSWLEHFYWLKGPILNMFCDYQRHCFNQSNTKATCFGHHQYSDY